MGLSMPHAQCRRCRLSSSIQAGTRVRAAALVAKVSRERSSTVRVECHASITALSRADPGRPIDGRIRRRPQAARIEVRGVLAAAVGVQDHPGHLAAAHRHRHRQRPVSELRIVMLGQGEPHHPPGAHIQHRGQVQRALTGGDLCSIALPFLGDGLGGEVPFHHIRGTPAAPPGPGRRSAPFPAPCGETLLTHQRRDGVLAEGPPLIPQLRVILGTPYLPSR
jgi:hypothetical protein